jgi:hypothetical protein
MKLEVEIDDRLILDLLVSGVEGARYWGFVYQTANADGWLVFENEFGFETGEVLQHATYELDIKRGIQLALTKYPRVLDSNQLDATTGDMFVQLCAFGELRYG